MGFYVTRKCGHRLLVTNIPKEGKEWVTKFAKSEVCRECRLKRLKSR
jgi:hypothetical protein